MRTALPMFLSILLSACTPVPLEILSVLELEFPSVSQAPELSGLAVEPETGRILLLDPVNGIFAVRNETPDLVVPRADMPRPDRAPASAWTDIFSMEEGKLGLTARNDGFLYDRDAETIEAHFCYVPPMWAEPRVVIEQETHAGDFHPETGTIVIQPRTWRTFYDEAGREDGRESSAQIGLFDGESGEPLRWYELPKSSFQAGGLVREGRDSVLLGQGSSLYRFTLDDQAFEKLGSVFDYGIERIEGMEWSGSGTLLILDGRDDEIYEVELL